MSAETSDPALPDHAGPLADFEEIIDQGLGLTPLSALLEQAAAAQADPVQLAAVAHVMRQRFMSLQTIGDHIGMTKADVFLLLHNVPADTVRGGGPDPGPRP